MKIIGIGGTNGSGKDSLAEILAKDHKFLFVSGSDILREELRRLGLPIERENLRNLSTEWRKKYGNGILIARAFKDFKSRQSRYKGLVVASLRNPGEAEEIHKIGGSVVWLDADPHLRYKRVYSRQRSTEDQKTFEEFLQEERDEMEHSGDHHTLSLAGVKERADIFITNNSNDLEVFKKIVQKALADYL